MRPHVSAVFWLSTAIGVAIGAAGCGSDFDPYNRLTAPRVLAIKSDPPTPGPGEQAMLSALVYVPEGETVAYHWSWCPAPGSANEGYPCMLSGETLGQLAGSGPIDYDLGSAPTAALRIGVPAEPLKAVCAGLVGAMGGGAAAAFKPDCRDGFPMQVKLEVTVSGPDRPAETLTAVHTLNIRLEDSQAHHNPTIEGLSARPLEAIANGGATDALVVQDGSVDGQVDASASDAATQAGQAQDAGGNEAGSEEGAVAIDDRGLLELPRNKKIELRADFAATVAESYVGRDDQGLPQPEAREKVFLTWFVEGGDTKSERTTFIEGTAPLEKARVMEWKTPKTKDFERDKVRILVVIRDGRGGVGWRTALVRLGGMP